MNDARSIRWYRVPVRLPRLYLVCFSLVSLILFYQPSFSQCLTWYVDLDGDGFGSTADVQSSCTPLAGYVLNQLDCNDNSNNTPGWKLAGGAGFSQSSVTFTKITMAPDGAPLVVYRNFSTDISISRITVKKFNGLNWVTLGSDPITVTENMYNPDIIVDSNGIPYLAYVDFDIGGSTDNKITVRKYNAGTSTWELVGSRKFSGQTADDGRVNISLDQNDVPYVIYPNNAMEAVVMKYDNLSGNWLTVGAGGLPGVANNESAIAIDATGKPTVAVSDANDGKLTVMQFNGTSWISLGSPSFSDNDIDVPQLVIDGANVPYVAYFDYGLNEVVVQKYNAATTSWSKIGNASAHSGSASYVSLAIDYLDVPVVAYLDNAIPAITVKRLNSSNNWVAVAASEFNGLEVSLAIGPGSIPFASFLKLDESDKAAVQMLSPKLSVPDVPTLSATQTTTCSGASTTLSIATGSLRDATRWQWYSGSCGGTPLGTGSSLAVSPSTTTTYFVRGEGTCITTPGACRSIAITVNPLPTITAQPVTGIAVCEGASGSLSVAGSGTGLAYQWYADKNDGNGWGALTGETAATLTLNGVIASMNNYLYRATVRNTTTNCLSTSSQATLTVNTLPVITAQPIASVTLCEGSNAAFSATVTGANLAYQWQINSSGSWTPLTGETNSAINLNAITYAMNGFQYRVTARNTVTTCASTSSPALLAVNTAPAISSVPADVAVCSGGTAGFTAAATGTNLLYQWQVNTSGTWNDLTGQTATSLSLTGLTTASNGNQYRMVARNTGCTQANSQPALLTVNVASAITTNPSSIAVCAGGTAAFSPLVSGTNLLYQWERNSGSGWTNITGETSLNLSINGVTTAITGYQYRLRAYNSGCTASTSVPAVLTVNTAPLITADPASTAICAGSAANFTATASGTNLTYQWQVNSGSTWNMLTGETAAGLSLSAVNVSANGNQYRLVASNAGCTAATSIPATLTVNTAPAITSNPSSTAVCSGNTASFASTASGTNLTYQWEVNTGSGWNDITGETAANLSFSGASALSGNQYRLEVSNAGCSAAFSQPATLVVNAGPAIVTNPSSHAICAGSNTTFTATASGTNLTYQWQVNSGSTWNILTGETAPGLSLNAVNASANGNQYRLVVSNAGCTGVNSMPATLTVNTAPAITSNPSSIAVCSGNTASFASTATGTNLVYQWEVNTGSGWNDITGETAANLSFSGASTLTGNQYRLEVSNAGCSAAFSQPATLVVNAGPSIVTNPSSQAICTGGNTTFTAAANGTNLTYQWRVNTGSGFTNISNGGVYSGSNTTTLTITGSTTALHNHTYQVVVSNTGCSPVTSTNAMLTVDTPPVVAVHPINRTVCDGNTTSFVTTVNGSNLSYQWQVNTGTGYSNVTDGGMYSGANTNTLSIAGATTSMNGFTYQLLASNAGCTQAISNSSALTVNTPATVTDPANVTICAGSNAVLTTVATGTNLNYQWQRNNGAGWNNISGETNPSLTLLNPAPATSGYGYRVVVSNDNCTPATSQGAVVTVDTPPAISNNPANALACAGETVTFGATATGTNLTYQWQQNDGTTWTDLTGETAATYIITSATVTINNYQFRVLADNIGCTAATSAAASLTVNTSSGIVTQPDDVVTCDGADALFSVAATGSNLRYQWEVNQGTGWNVLSGSVAAGLSVTGSTSEMNGYQYRVIVGTDGCPPITSDAAILSVNEAPSITTQPQSVEVCSQNNTSFVISSAGTGLSYQWQVNENNTWLDLPGETNPELIFTTVTPEMNGYQYQVMVSNIGCAPVTSDAVTLTVNTEPGSPGCPLLLLVSEGLSPNGDNELDHWVIQGIERYPDNKIRLFNIWGDLIFEQNGYDNASQVWRGESNRGAKIGGSQAPDGTYYYLIDLGNKQLLRGFVVLKR
jgi:gliding motility-associated-like protein